MTTLAALLAPQPPAPERAPVETWRETLLALAHAEMGKRYAGPVIGEPESYRWGDPGWDCSSFVSALYRRAAGVTLTPFTDAAYDQCALVADPQPADVVFYRYVDPSQPGVRLPHMGIFVSATETLDCRWPQGVGIHPHVTRGTIEVRRPKALTSAPVVTDNHGRDLVPLVRQAEADYDVAAWAVLGMLRAESALRSDAERWGDRTTTARELLARQDWPGLSALVRDLQARKLGSDISFGCSQITIGTAAGLGVGDGSSTVANILKVRELLFDPARAIDRGTAYLRQMADYVRNVLPGAVGENLWLLACRAYNGGPGYGLTAAYDRAFAGHIRAYEEGFAWARAALGD